jgi:mono/diheme cytochrome c family protein
LSAIAALLVCQAAAWAQNIDVGEMEYLSSCAPCHGRNANGKGPLADQLKVEPIDLRQLAKMNGGVFPMNAVYEKTRGEGSWHARDAYLGLSLSAFPDRSRSDSQA